MFSNNRKIGFLQNLTKCRDVQSWEEMDCGEESWNCGEKTTIVTDILVEAIFICGK